ncbi:MAG: alpha/beta fold hydrolase [archaeon]
MGAKTVSFQTNDNYTIVGTYLENPGSTKPPVILVHQLGSDRYSFDSFAAKLFNDGFTVLSIDLRGHGDSTQKGSVTVSFTQFTDTDWKKIPQDINAAAVFLKTSNPFVIGASIGANAALQYASNYPSTHGIVLLSPGINYRGVDVTTAMKNNTVSTLIIASNEDSYSAQSSQSLFSTLAISDKKLLLVENAGHGTAMLITKPELMDEILAWLNEHSS